MYVFIFCLSVLPEMLNKGEYIIRLKYILSDLEYRRKVKFLTKLLHSGNIVCSLFADSINRELANLAANLT